MKEMGDESFGGEGKCMVEKGRERGRERITSLRRIWGKGDVKEKEERKNMDYFKAKKSGLGRERRKGREVKMRYKEGVEGRGLEGNRKEVLKKSKKA